MRRVFTAAVFMIIAALGAGAEEKTDNQKIADELARTEARFLKSIEGLSEAQWNFKPAPDRWSVAECAEHIAASEPMIRSFVAKAAANQPTDEMVKAGMRKDEAVGSAIVDRSKKFKAPEPLVPTNRFGSPAAAIEAFTKERAETIKLASTGDLRAHGDNHFAFGPLDAYGFFLFLSAHSERHTLQIDEVKAHPDFPKK